MQQNYSHVVVVLRYSNDVDHMTLQDLKHHHNHQHTCVKPLSHSVSDRIYKIKQPRFDREMITSDAHCSLFRRVNSLFFITHSFNLKSF